MALSRQYGTQECDLANCSTKAHCQGLDDASGRFHTSRPANELKMSY